MGDVAGSGGALAAGRLGDSRGGSPTPGDSPAWSSGSFGVTSPKSSSVSLVMEPLESGAASETLLERARDFEEIPPRAACPCEAELGFPRPTFGIECLSCFGTDALEHFTPAGNATRYAMLPVSTDGKGNARTPSAQARTSVKGRYRLESECARGAEAVRFQARCLFPSLC
jgi:hypothetical protein